MFFTREIDLHELTVDEALKFLILCCREEWKSGKRNLKVIHGYGSGGKIKKAVRDFLKKNSDILEYETGEGIDLNQGYTIIILKGLIEGIKNVIDESIVEFCNIPKTMDKIAGEFRKYGEKDVAVVVIKLVRSGKLKEVIKGKYKCYEKVIV